MFRSPLRPSSECCPRILMKYKQIIQLHKQNHLMLQYLFQALSMVSCLYFISILVQHPDVGRRGDRNMLFFLWRCDPTPVMASSFLGFLDHTQRRTTVGRTPLDEWSARRRDLYLTTHNTHNRQTSMRLLGFEPTISAGERPQTYATDRAAIGTGERNI